MFADLSIYLLCISRANKKLFFLFLAFIICLALAFLLSEETMKKVPVEKLSVQVCFGLDELAKETRKETMNVAAQRGEHL